MIRVTCKSHWSWQTKKRRR